MNKGQRARKNTLRKKVLNHHILYQYDGLTHKQKAIEVPLYHNEHYIVKLLQTRGKWVSRGFLQSLKYFIWERETTNNFVDLPRSQENTIQKTESKNTTGEPCQTA